MQQKEDMVINNTRLKIDIRVLFIASFVLYLYVTSKSIKSYPVVLKTTQDTTIVIKTIR